MIRYSKKYWGLHVLFRMYGSAFPRALPFSLSSAAIAGLLAAFFPTSTTWELFKHPYPFQTFAFVAGFMIVFRSNLSYGRYWEGRTQLQQMTSKLTDSVVMALQFDKTAVPKANATPEQLEQHAWFRDTFVHLISLMHAVALATLREDFNMENLVAHDSFAQAPRYNVRSSDLDGLDGMPEEAPTSGSSGGAAGMPHADGKRGGATTDGNAGGKPHARLHAPATDTQPQSEKANALAGMRSLKDYFILRTDPEHAQHIHCAMKLPVIGGFTQAEGIALGAFTTSGENGPAVPNLDVGIHGIILGDGTYAPAPTERVHTVLAWAQQVLIERIHDGGVKAAPPIQSRIHQVLSDGMLGYEQCKKLTETPFPFPWAQAVNIVLLLFCLTLPIIVVAFARHPYVAAVVTFIAAHTHVMLNEVARDIEDPFHYDPNELPLPQMQYKLNERLLAVTRSKRPLAFTDVGDLTGPGNTVQMPPSGPAVTQGSTAHAETIQAGTMSGPAPASQPPRTPLSPAPPGLSSAPSGTHGGFLGTNTATTVPSTPLSGDPPTSPAATSGSLEPMMSERPVPMDASDICSYSTANVPQEVSETALRWRNFANGSSKPRRRNVAGGDGGGTTSPSPDPMQSAPAMRSAMNSQRGSRRMASMPARVRRSGEHVSAEGDSSGMEHLQVVVAANDMTRLSSGAVFTQQQAQPQAAHPIPHHKSFSFSLGRSESAPDGPAAVAASGGGPLPVQADPGQSPFIADELAADASAREASPAVEPTDLPRSQKSDQSQTPQP